MDIEFKTASLSLAIMQGNSNLHLAFHAREAKVRLEPWEGTTADLDSLNMKTSLQWKFPGPRYQGSSDFHGERRVHDGCRASAQRADGSAHVLFERSAERQCHDDSTIWVPVSHACVHPLAVGLGSILKSL